MYHYDPEVQVLQITITFTYIEIVKIFFEHRMPNFIGEWVRVLCIIIKNKIMKKFPFLLRSRYVQFNSFPSNNRE